MSYINIIYTQKKVKLHDRFYKQKNVLLHKSVLAIRRCILFNQFYLSLRIESIILFR